MSQSHHSHISRCADKVQIYCLFLVSGSISQLHDDNKLNATYSASHFTGDNHHKPGQARSGQARPGQARSGQLINHTFNCLQKVISSFTVNSRRKKINVYQNKTEATLKLVKTAVEMVVWLAVYTYYLIIKLTLTL